jgi:hypothetical protein
VRVNAAFPITRSIPARRQFTIAIIGVRISLFEMLSNHCSTLNSLRRACLKTPSYASQSSKYTTICTLNPSFSVYIIALNLNNRDPVPTASQYISPQGICYNIMGLSNEQPAAFPEPDEISRLVNLISKLGTNANLKDAKTRKALIAASRSLSLSLETPMEALLRMYWAEVSRQSRLCNATQTLNSFSLHFELSSMLDLTCSCLTRWPRKMVALRLQLNLRK